MREVDTDALLGVAPFLKVGNPATATRQVVFDDENLQQVLDVTPLIARQSGFMVQISSSVDPALSSTLRSSNALEDLYPLGIDDNASELLGADSMEQLDAYLARLYAVVATADEGNLSEVQMGVLYTHPITGVHRVRALYRSTSLFGTNPLSSTDGSNLTQSGQRSNLELYPVLPMYLTWQSSLLGLATANANGPLETSFLFDLWICRKGVPLNFAV